MQVVLNCVISYYQERQTSKVMSQFANMMPAQCVAIRDARQTIVHAEALVPGDVVLLNGGDKIPADARILHTSGLRVESSSLTGESEPYEVAVSSSEPEDRALEARNLVFAGCSCVSGSAVAVVFQTGSNTVIGRVASLASSTSSKKTTLQIEVDRFVRFVTILALVLATSCFIAALILGYSLVDAFIVAFITILVANVPQGLPATVTSCLTIAAQRMRVRHVFVRRLDAVETLGSASVICSDKTGTLTQNVMSVQNFWYNGHLELCNGNLHRLPSRRTTLHRTDSHKSEDMIKRSDTLVSIGGPEVSSFAAEHLSELAFMSAVCNRAQFDEEVSAQSIAVQLGDDRTQRSRSVRIVRRASCKIIGDASETALLRFADSVMSVHRVRQRFPVLFEV